MAKKSKLTLLVDGNWLLISRMSVMYNRYTDEQDLARELKTLMTRSINVVLRQFPEIDNVIIVSDGGSWRNQLPVPEFLQVDGVTYKGNREKSDDINWDLIFRTFDEWLQENNQNGVTTSFEKGVEGDDWCWYWSNKLNNENTNVIVWTKDRDLTQLIKMDANSCFTVWWNKDNGVFTNPKKYDELNVLLNPFLDDNLDVYEKVCKHGLKVTEVDPHEVILDKIIRGDAGDNILPIITKMPKSPTSNRIYRVAAKDIDYTLDYNNDEAVKGWIHSIFTNKSYEGRIPHTEEQVFEHFKYNVRLVVLNEKSYTPEINEVMNTHDTYSCSTNTVIVESVQNAAQNNLQNILDII